MWIWEAKKKYKHKLVREILRELAIANDIENAESLKLKELIEKTHTYFFDFEYPMIEFKENHEDWYPSIANKDDFEIKFLKHFINEPICTEDEELFFIYLDEVLNRIMPFYIQYLKSEEWFPLYILDPSANTNYTESYTRSIDGTNTSDTIGNSKTSNTDITTVTGNNESHTDIKNENSSESTSNTKQSQTAESGNNQTGKTVQNDTPINMLDDTDYASSVGTNTSNVTQTSSGTATSDATDTTNGNSSSVTTDTSTNTDKTDSTGSSTSDTTSNTKGESKQVETYEFKRLGNIGIQTPGYVFNKTRESFLNTLEKIYKDKSVCELFDGYESERDWI